MFEAKADHQPVVIAHLVLFERGNNLRDLLFRCPLGKLRYLGGIGWAFQQRLQHQLSGYTKNVRKHAAQLDVGVFQGLLDSVLFAASGLNYLPAPPRQIPQFSLPPRRDKTGREHGVAQQMRQPPGIFGICFVSSPRLDLIRIRQGYLNDVFHYVKDRLPVRTRALHNGVGTCLLLDPFPQLLELTDGCPKLADFGPGFPTRRSSHHASYQELLTHVGLPPMTVPAVPYDPTILSHFHPRGWRNSSWVFLLGDPNQHDSVFMFSCRRF